MSIQQNFPGFMPSLNLNFAKSKRLDQRVTFQRQTGATITNELGLLERVGNNIPRFDHSYDASTGAIRSLGLLIEEQRTNLLPYTEDFSSNWSHIGFTSNAVDSTYANPTGSLGTKKLIEDGPTNQKVLYRYHNVDDAGGNNQIFSHSCFVKPIGNRHAQLNIHNAGSPARGISVNFDLNNIDTPFSTSISSFASSVSYGVIPYPNGWYKLYLIGNTSSQDSDGTTLAFHVRILNASGFSNYTGDGSSGLYVYGAQMEVGAFPTSYIPTQGLPVTRLADNAYIDGENFTSFYNQVEGTVFTSFRRNTNGSIVRVFNIDDGTNTNRISGLASDVFYQTYVNPAAVGPTATFSETDTYKVASGHQDNNMQVYVNGFYQQSNTSITIPKNLNTFRIGNWHNNTSQGTTISQLIYYPRRLTNNQLQQLTR